MMARKYDPELPLLPTPMYGYFGTHGNSSAYIDCPICGHKRILVYLWSLHGSGKLCPTCGSKFSGFGCDRNILWKGGK